LIHAFSLISFCLDTKRNKKIKSQKCWPRTCRGAPAFGSGHRAGTEMTFAYVAVLIGDDMQIIEEVKSSTSAQGIVNSFCLDKRNLRQQYKLYLSGVVKRT
jgi:hypothetical protein